MIRNVMHTAVLRSVSTAGQQAARTIASCTAKASTPVARSAALLTSTQALIGCTGGIILGGIVGVGALWVGTGLGYQYKKRNQQCNIGMQEFQLGNYKNAALAFLRAMGHASTFPHRLLPNTLAMGTMGIIASARGRNYPPPTRFAATMRQETGNRIWVANLQHLGTIAQQAHRDAGLIPAQAHGQEFGVDLPAAGITIVAPHANISTHTDVDNLLAEFDRALLQNTLIPWEHGKLRALLNGSAIV